jgi:hypothetical protein
LRSFFSLKTEEREEKEWRGVIRLGAYVTKRVDKEKRKRRKNVTVKGSSSAADSVRFAQNRKLRLQKEKKCQEAKPVTTKFVCDMLIPLLLRKRAT